MDDKNSIKEILERAGADSNSESVEFEFAENTSVIFETEDTSDSKDETKSEEFEFFDGEQETPESEAAEAVEGGEFVLPDIFDIEEKSREIASADAAGLLTTYVPRFTEVSENYRMRGAEKLNEVTVSVNSEESLGSDDGIDPTAELSSSVGEENVVNLDKERPQETDETKTVYKFEDPSIEKPKPKIRTLEDEVREIDELMRPEEFKNKTAEELTEAEAEALDTEPAAEPAAVKVSSISDSAVREANRFNIPKDEKPKQTPTAVAELPKKAKNRDFSVPLQRDGFKDRFLDQLLSIKVRLAVAAFITLLLLVFENLSVIGVDLPAALRIPKYTGIPVLLDLQLAVCVFVLAIPEIVSAVYKVIKGKVTSEISVILSLVVLAVYSITVYSIKATDYPMFGFLFAVHADAAIASAYLKKSADFSSFKLISSKEKKKALVITPTRELVLENMALDGTVDEYKSKTVRIMRTAFVSDFFKRSGEVSERSITTLMMMGISLGASLVCGIVAYFLYDGWFSFVTAMTLVFLMAMPAFSVLTYKFVYYHAASAAKKESFALIGQSALSEYADADVVVFDDTEIFSDDDVKLRNFSGDMTKGMRQMSAIFSAVGGPLDKIFSSALDRKCAPAENISIEEDGISGNVDGKLIYAGTEAYMLRHGASFDSLENRAAASAADSSKIMYAAEDGEVYASFRISYSFSESFTMILPSLRVEKIVPLIVTRDPNITNELIKTLTMGIDSIRVLKKTDTAPRTEIIERTASAGLVGIGERAGALHAMLLCKKSAAFSSRLALTEIMALAVGAALGVALSLGGMIKAPTAALGLWQLLWCVGVGFLSYREYMQDGQE